MSSRRTTAEERERENPLQFFRTPPWATWSLLTWKTRSFQGARVLELGAGDGMIGVELLTAWPLQIREYVAVELDEERFELLQQNITGGTAVHANVLELGEEFYDRFDVVVMNPPFDNAHLFLLAALKFLRPVGRIFMLQRCTYPGESQTDRDQLFKHDNPVGASLGFYAELTLTNRVDFKGDGKADSVNHSWFAFAPGHVFPKNFKPTREHVRRAACPWDRNREPELPRQTWAEAEKQIGLF